MSSAMKQLFSRMLRLSGILAGLLLSTAALNTAHADNWTQQRSVFFSAQQALNSGDISTFQQLTASLDNYPLAVYLHYLYLEPRLDRVSDAEVLQFLARYGETGHGELLRRKWLYILAKREAWPTFMTAMKGYQLDEDYVTLRCHYLTAQLRTGRSVQTLKNELFDLWLVGKSQPDACDPAFASLYSSHLITDALLWERVKLAMDNGVLGVATALSQQFSNPNNAQWVELWQTMHRSPSATLSSFNQPDSVIARTVIVHGIKTLAKDSYQQAAALWAQFRPHYAFSVEQLTEAKAALAIAAYKQDAPEAYALMTALLSKQVPDNADDDRFIAALKRLDWPAVADFVRELPADQQTDLQWRYWYARALSQTGQKDSSSGKTGRELMQDVAQARDYYGFLAAEQLGQPHKIVHQATPTSPMAEAALLKLPSMAAAQEFYQLDLMTNARREWNYMSNHVTSEQLGIAAVLAQRWGWYDRAIFTVAQAGLFDDLNLRFPLAYYDELLTGAKNQQVDLAWVYGITRQESAFMHSVSSHAGALGLMQLMPSTGRYVARRIGMRIKSNADILKVENNVMLGTAYLKQMLDSFDGNYMLATAAYNAGPGRAKRWAAENGCLPTDVWVELIPFSETRTYVRRVMFYTRIFESQLKRSNPQPLRLSLAGQCAQ